MEETYTPRERDVFLFLKWANHSRRLLTVGCLTSLPITLLDNGNVITEQFSCHSRHQGRKGSILVLYVDNFLTVIRIQHGHTRRGSHPTRGSSARALGTHARMAVVWWAANQTTTARGGKPSARHLLSTETTPANLIFCNQQQNSSNGLCLSLLHLLFPIFLAHGLTTTKPETSYSNPCATDPKSELRWRMLRSRQWWKSATDATEGAGSSLGAAHDRLAVACNDPKEIAVRLFAAIGCFEIVAVRSHPGERRTFGQSQLPHFLSNDFRGRRYLTRFHIR